VPPGGVGEAVGHALGFDDALLARDGGDLLAGLGRFLSRRRTAVVLDNCEHLVEEVASFVAGLLDLVPGDSHDSVKVLMRARGLVDVLIPRGGAGLIRSVVEVPGRRRRCG
jgi:glutamate-5-semialdehyde dehydrogenase